jgi:hypothetical protein
MPVFSTRKAFGFNDILFPSPQDYEDAIAESSNTQHSLPFNKTKSSLFWRGTFTEGESAGGAWQGMTPQRAVFMANQVNAPQAVLLPMANLSVWWTKTTLKYTNMPIVELAKQLPMDIRLAQSASECQGPDCDEQAQVFISTKKAGLQQHYRHRYLLTLDDVQSRGNFLKFLRSGSVPFRASIFREWYDRRLTPWLHFVPIDVRLHGLWATLGYFSGLRSKIGGGNYPWKPHFKEAELIASEGRKWARSTLRKEDMEIYLFRLLLEWGRLTDDDRDVLGFVVQ